ncbi:MAG: NAD(P)/FAD-dependent oxidoreductase [Planctomycetota bacterium]|jgi:sarcosine oxidase subunit beta
MTETCDLIVIGAGIVGLAIAERLTATGMGKVLILEKEAVPATGSTGKSAGGIRQQFGDPRKIEAARFGMEFYDSFAQRYGVDPEFKKHGYLILRSDAEGASGLKEEVKVQKLAGLDTRFLEPEHIKQMIPELNTTDLSGGSFNGADGYLDPHTVVQGFLQAFRTSGGELACAERAVALIQDGDRILGVRTDQREIHAGATILAPGPHVSGLLDPLGIRLPLRTCRRQIFSTGPVAGVKEHWPLILDVDAPFYFRPESGGVIMSLAEIDEIDPPQQGNEIPVSRKKLPALAQAATHRCPILEEARIQSGWAGIRTLTPDERPVLGPMPGWQQLFIAAGFSGHGITLSPFAAEFIHLEVRGKPLAEKKRAPYLARRFGNA